ncbi:multicopper oxidase domain-containing protein [Acinetobacter larvae]|uniref:Copper oxidase n=1 Tax=Acinetobacter larvae TaxID=1789224 RepID=A0A1B2LWM3_9GAMM|nr:multicopper oxidase domain-containing protein [Acinetobacter larvae]AOA57346.1 copper oxidase [Acinetobacter larvae]
MSIFRGLLTLTLLSFIMLQSAVAAVREYHLSIAEKPVRIGDKTFSRIVVNDQFTAPLLAFEEGDEAVIHVHNKLKKQDSSVHWHGLLLPGLMDGVPGLNGFQAIPADGHFSYRFKIRQSGSYWYHAHSRAQEQDGLYGPLVIYPKGHFQQPVAADQDYVMMLSDFHPSRGEQIMRNLKKSADYYQNQRETFSDVWRQSQQDGWQTTWQQRKMWNQMRMLRTDLSDVTGYAFLLNGQPNTQPWTGLFQPQQTVRLRFINASAMSFFDVRIPGLKMTVVAADGQAVQPVTVDEFRIGTAETYDVLVEPSADAYQIEAESIDRSGFALARLQNAQAAPVAFAVPQARPRALLTMQDMGHGEMHGHDQTHSEQHQPTSSHGQTEGSHATNHSSMPHIESDSSHDHSSMSHIESDSSHDHSSMLHTEPDSSHDHSSMSQMQAQAHSGDAQSTVHNMVATDVLTMSDQLPTVPHQSIKPATVEGWGNAATPAGHRALQYQDLKAVTPQPDQRPATRELEIRLDGNMERYIWTLNGKTHHEATPLQVGYGERVRLKFINDSMMAHPMHLHGMFMQLENGQSAAYMPNKHTLIVAPGQSVSVLLTANELGEWAIHCHLLYHMTAGMMNKLVVAHVHEQTQNNHAVQHSTTVEAQHAHE